MLVRQAMVKQQPFEFNTYNTECITDFNTELAIPLGKKKLCKNTTVEMLQRKFKFSTLLE